MPDVGLNLNYVFSSVDCGCYPKVMRVQAWVGIVQILEAQGFPLGSLTEAGLKTEPSHFLQPTCVPSLLKKRKA